MKQILLSSRSSRLRKLQIKYLPLCQSFVSQFLASKVSASRNTLASFNRAYTSMILHICTPNIYPSIYLLQNSFSPSDGVFFSFASSVLAPYPVSIFSALDSSNSHP
jgi:hypothetical protein